MNAITEPTPSSDSSLHRRAGASSPTTRQNSESTVTQPPAPKINNIWDSAWAAISQTPPPGLSEVLSAYSLKGENDREMLLRILHAKSAEDERIASIASLHRTILELQSAALAVQSHAVAPPPGTIATPSSTPPLHSPPTPHYRHHHPHDQQRIRHQQPSASPPNAHHHHHPHHERKNSYHQPQNGYPILPPIASMGTMTYGEPPRKRSRPSPPDTTTGSASSGPLASRASPEYPLSPYSGEPSSNGRGGGHEHHHARRPSLGSAGYANGAGSGASHAWSGSSPAPPYANGAGSRGRVSVNALLGAGCEDDGDVKYRRMSAERSSR